MLAKLESTSESHHIISQQGTTVLTEHVLEVAFVAKRPHTEVYVSSDDEKDKLAVFVPSSVESTSCTAANVTATSLIPVVTPPEAVVAPIVSNRRVVSPSPSSAVSSGVGLSGNRVSRPVRLTPADERSRFLEYLFTIGKTLYPVAGDGACFYRSLAVALDRDARQHTIYRRQAMDYMDSHRVEFRNIEPGVDGNGLSRHIAHGRRSHAWVD